MTRNGTSRKRSLPAATATVSPVREDIKRLMNRSCATHSILSQCADRNEPLPAADCQALALILSGSIDLLEEIESRVAGLATAEKKAV